MLIAWKTYQHRYVFHVANQQKVDIDNRNSEENASLGDLIIPLIGKEPIPQCLHTYAPWQR